MIFVSLKIYDKRNDCDFDIVFDIVFSKFYRHHQKFVSKFNLFYIKTYQTGILWRHIQFKKIMGRTDFPDQFQKIIIRQKPIGYNLNVM